VQRGHELHGTEQLRSRLRPRVKYALAHARAPASTANSVNDDRPIVDGEDGEPTSSTILNSAVFPRIPCVKFRMIVAEMFEAHFRDDHAEGHRQDDQ
jgi:hypothetical protein